MSTANKTLINKDLVAQRFGRHFASYDKKAAPQQAWAKRLWACFCDLAGHDIAFQRVLEIGCGTGYLTRYLAGLKSLNMLYLNDIAPEAFDFVAPLVRHVPTTFLTGDAETLRLPAQLDAIFSASTLQWFDNIELFLHNITQHDYLQPGGYLVVSTFANQHYRELFELSQLTLNYKTEAQWRDLLQKNFDIGALFSEQTSEIFNSARHMLHELRALGVSGLSNKPLTRGAMHDFCDAYQQRYGIFCPETGELQGVTLTLNPIFFVAKRKL